MLKKVTRLFGGLGDGPAGGADAGHDTTGGGDAATDSLGIAHLNEGQVIGLRDDTLGGFFNNATGELFRDFPLGNEDVLVDIGCGGGGPLGFASKFAGRIIAIDVVEDAINDARAYLTSRGADMARTEFLLGTAEDIPLPDGFASRVMCMEVLEHVSDPQRALSELVRIGRPGSLYLITVPDSRTETVMKTVAPASAFEAPNHIRLIDADQFARWVADAGLTIMRHEFNGFFRAMWLAMFWVRCDEIRRVTPELEPTTFDETDPVLLQWSRAWSSLLDTPHGHTVKTMLDRILPKSQIIVARKP